MIYRNKEEDAWHRQLTRNETSLQVHGVVLSFLLFVPSSCTLSQLIPQISKGSKVRVRVRVRVRFSFSFS